MRSWSSDIRCHLVSWIGRLGCLRDSCKSDAIGNAQFAAAACDRGRTLAYQRHKVLFNQLLR